MDKYVTVFLAMSVISIVVYTWVAIANYRLSNKLVQFNGDSVMILRLLAILCSVVLISDLFWVLVLLFPLISSDIAKSESFKTVFVSANAILRLAPAMVMFHLWSNLINNGDIE